MPKNNTAYKFRIYPNEEQKIMIAKTFGCCRFIYNSMLADKIEEYEKNNRMLKITPAGYKKANPWLKEVDSLALCNEGLHLDIAFKNFFDRKDMGFPRFKSKHGSRQSYTTNMVNNNIKLHGNRLTLPKIKNIRIVIHRELPADGYRLKSVTVSRESSGDYYASILYEYESCENQAEHIDAEHAEVLGIDYAMHGLAVLSDGTECDYPGFYRQQEARLKREQRRLSHCVKGSKNYKKQKIRVARCHRRIKNQRKDYLHKLSRKIADTYDAVAVEDIDMKAMSRCLNFGKSVMDNGYGMFCAMLKYKLERQNKRLIVIDRFFPSSKKCSCCGSIKSNLLLSDRVYECECGNRMNRDYNAALNIRDEGKRIIACV